MTDMAEGVQKPGELRFEEERNGDHSQPTKLFVEPFFGRCIDCIAKWTAVPQARLVPGFISARYNPSECCATMSVLVAALILLVSWAVSEQVRLVIIGMGFALAALALWHALGASSHLQRLVSILVAAVILLASWVICKQVSPVMALVRGALGAFAVWYALGAFSYPLKVVLVDLPAGGGLTSPVRSVILFFFNYAEITIHFASLYLLTQSIQDTSVMNQRVTPALTSLYFSIVTITTLGDGTIRTLGGDRESSGVC